MIEKDIIKLLATRYIKLIGHNKDQHLRNMCLTIIENIDKAPEGKLNRWLGYIQKGVVDLKLTTIAKENNFSKPLFEKAYKKEVIDVLPESSNHTSERLLPNPPTDGGWFWLKKPGKQWAPTFINGETPNYPPCLCDVHSTPIYETPETWIWGEMIPIPSDD